MVIIDGEPFRSNPRPGNPRCGGFSDFGYIPSQSVNIQSILSRHVPSCGLNIVAKSGTSPGMITVFVISGLY